MDWIKTEDRLPLLIKNIRKVKVKFKDGSEGERLYGNSGYMNEPDGWFENSIDKRKNEDITHWAEIEPPKD